MIEYRKGNLLDVNEGIIAHGVNCQGVMGSGVAKAIRDMYPLVYTRYKKHVDSWMEGFGNSAGLLGQVHFCSVVEPIPETGPILVVANCFTQDLYGTDRRHVNYEAVAQCFRILNKRFMLYGDVLHIPKIGAGLAGGDWNVISAIIESEFKGDVVCWEL